MELEETRQTTQFRQAEKEYQRNVREIFRQKRHGKKKFDKLVEDDVNLDDVVDVDTLDSSSSQWGEIEARVIEGSTVYSFSRHPGMYLIRQAIPERLMKQMARDCFTTLLQPPATTNFNKSHGVQLDRVWEAAHADMMLAPSGTVSQWSEDGEGPSAQYFLDNLRWASIGPVYDWTLRRYRVEDEYIPLPEYMVEFAKEVVSRVNAHHGTTDFRPNAALINYYREGDKLCGHRDDAETDQTKPLVSCSIGCPAIFLMGGCDRNMYPTPILLRHGDVVLLSGQARTAYHGLPRIFPEVRKLSSEVDEMYPRDSHLVGLDPDVLAYLKNCRINISIREVT